jgi:iron-sulfur cluster repair protein YtfE (RIC family)
VQKGSGPLDAEWTVGDVLHHYPGTGSIMKDMGVDHCCGAHLTLREAGAAAGVPLPALLEALNRRALAPA